MAPGRQHHDPHTVKVACQDSRSAKTASFGGPVTFTTWGSEQYVWKDDGPNSHADRDDPPAGKRVAGGPQATYLLPKASITVLRGKLQGIAE